MYYTYETWPGETIVRARHTRLYDGYTVVELLEQLHVNGDGIVVSDDEHDDPITRRLAGQQAREAKL